MTKKVMFDGNTSASYVAHAVNEVCAIYPITPSSVMGELADEWSSKGQKNIWGNIPVVSELQSEGGAAGAIHGALTAGALATTFTASQGLLLMIPNMYKIAGELAPTVFHVSARSLSCQALSIFGDHSDVMSARETGFAFLAAANVQEVMDNALAAQRCTLKSRVPMVQFFDGFRTSHEIQKIDSIDYDVMRKMIDEDDVLAVRERALRPEKPSMRGTAQNPDIYFQGREAANKFYTACPDIMQACYDELAKHTGRQYHLFDYVGDPQAETVMIIMGSGGEAAEEAIKWLNANQGKKYGMVKVRLYRPFSMQHLLAVLPKTAQRVVVMDRSKALGAPGEPLYQDVACALQEGVRHKMYPHIPLLLGGRYGLSSKEFTPSMVYACFKHADSADPFHGFTVGINDDVTHLSLDFSEEIDTEDKSCYRAKFWGLGSDGTVGASKNNIKVVGDNTNKYAQGYFVYDSKKAGGVTCSHLRFSDAPIQSTYLISRPDFVAIHAESFIGKIDLLKGIKEGGTVLINTYSKPEELFNKLPQAMQETIINKKLKVYCINAYDIVDELGLPGRINTTMQGAFFKLSGVLAEDVYRKAIEGAIEKTFARKGTQVVDINVKAFRAGIEQVHTVPVPAAITESMIMPERITAIMPGLEGFVTGVVDPVMAQEGDSVPVSQIPFDGAFPTDTTKYEKRSIAVRLPKWDSSLCIQCNMCAFVCPHAAIRPKISKAGDIKDAAYVTIPFKDKEAAADDVYRIQLYPDDCTGCGACVTACLGKDKADKERKALSFVHKDEILEESRLTLKIYRELPATDLKFFKPSFKGVGFHQPLFQFSGACAGCGETPYVRLISQLFGTRMLHANATGCSSIYGGTAPTSPCAIDKLTGYGPAWASSLFEDNAEFGLGMRLAVDKLHERAFAERERLLADGLPGELKDRLTRIHTVAEQYTDPSLINANMELVRDMQAILAQAGSKSESMITLEKYLPYFIKKSVWILGGDGWAYDIGFGGLDHVMAGAEDVNLLVLDTEVYSNTGGQKSKATPLGAVTKFASAGKRLGKKDLGLEMMSYQHCYVAQISYTANPNQAVKAIIEAEQYPGPSILIAYSNCIEHGIDMSNTEGAGNAAVDSGYWLLYRYDPRLIHQGKNPLQLDSRARKISFMDFAQQQNRFRRLKREKPEEYDQVMKDAEVAVNHRFEFYRMLAEMDYSTLADTLSSAATGDVPDKDMSKNADYRS
jgi:pyruvate-ferredoxin/flavodoxin oxidoreductase